MTPYIEKLKQHLIDDEWTENEVQRFLNYTEEMNPDLKEEVALKHMKQIVSQVSARLGRPTILNNKEPQK